MEVFKFNHKMKNKEVSIFHLCIYSKLKDVKNYDKTIERKKLIGMLGAIYHIPKEHRKTIIEELKAMNFLEELDKFKFRVLC